MLPAVADRLNSLDVTHSMTPNAMDGRIQMELWCIRQVFISILSDMDIVLDPHSAHFPIFIQHGFVNVLSQRRVSEIWLNDELAKVDAGLHGNYTSGWQRSSGHILVLVLHALRVWSRNTYLTLRYRNMLSLSA